jgi:hypothetical protein
MVRARRSSLVRAVLPHQGGEELPDARHRVPGKLLRVNGLEAILHRREAAAAAAMLARLK